MKLEKTKKFRYSGKMMRAPKPVTVEVKPAPSFSVNFETGVALATIYTSHYERMQAVVDAARCGNRVLLKLALAHHDRFGSEDDSEKLA